MTDLPAPDGPDPASLEAPERYLGSSRLLDLQDSRLRLRAHSLAQLCETPREQALSIYNFVKKLPFERRFKLRVHTAREVMDAGRGDASDKAALLVALLRCARIPARILFVELRGEALRGLAIGMATAPRPIVEAWLGERWVRTDTYIYDLPYVAAARQRLKDSGWEWGYGIHRNGQSVWNGVADSFLGGCPIEKDPMVVQVLGVYDDPLQFVRSDFFHSKYPPLARALYWNLLALAMRRVVRNLRDEGTPRASTERFGRPS